MCDAMGSSRLQFVPVSWLSQAQWACYNHLPQPPTTCMQEHPPHDHLHEFGTGSVTWMQGADSGDAAPNMQALDTARLWERGLAPSGGLWEWCTGGQRARARLQGAGPRSRSSDTCKAKRAHGGPVAVAGSGSSRGTRTAEGASREGSKSP
jgi:hypothetical protein